MKTILGAFAVSVVLFTACGGDGGSTDSPQGSTSDGGNDAGGADSGTDTLGGEAGKSTAPTMHGGETSDGGVGAGEGGSAATTGGSPGGPSGDGGAAQPANSPVSGHILSMSGVALEGAVVTIDGQSALTDEDGAFAFDDVTPKYDVTVIYENEAANFHAAEIVDGLTTRELSLRVWLARFETSSAGAAGKVSPTVPKGHEGLVQIAGPHSDAPVDTLSAGTTDYALLFNWEGGGNGVADIVALEWVPGATGPSSYTGFARKSVQPANGSGAVANLTLSKPPQKAVTGTVVADGPTPPDSYLSLGRLQVPLALSAGAFSVVVPDIGEEPSISVGAQTGDAYATMTAPTSLAPLTLEVPPTAKLILPVNKAQVDLNTEFSFTRPGKLAAVWWAVGAWIVVHVTDQTKLKLPDLRGAGIVYEAGDDPGPWFVDTYSPAETPEDFLALMGGTSPALTTSVTTSTSTSRNFYLAK